MKVKLDFKCKLIFSETSRRLIYLCRKESKSKALNFQKQQINEEDDSFKAMINEKNESIPTFDEIRCKLDTKITEFSLMQYEHFAKIKNDIDIKRETLLEEVTKKSKITATINLERYIEDIHRTSAQMISQVEMAEDSFRRNFNLSKKFLTNNESKNTDDEEKLKLIEKKLKNFKLFEYDLLRNKFTPYSYELIATFDSKTFGRLELFDDFVQKIDGNDDDIYSYEILNVATSFTRLFGRNEIQILNLNTKSIVKELSGHLGVVFCLIAHGSTQLISGSEDKTIRIWDLMTGECIKTLREQTLNAVLCLKLIDSNQLVSGSKNITIWDLSKEIARFTLNGHLDFICCLEISPSGNLISGSKDKTIKIWNLSKRVCIRTLRGHFKSVSCLRVFKNDFLISCSDDRRIKIWKDFDMVKCINLNHIKSMLTMNRVGNCVKTLTGHTDLVLSLDINIETNRMISSSADETIRIWDLSDMESCKCLQVLSGHTDFVCCVKFLNKMGTRIVSGSYDGSIKVWDINTGICLRTILTDSTIWRLEICSAN